MNRSKNRAGTTGTAAGALRRLFGAALLRPIVPPNRVQLKERGGIWEVRVDGAFHGDYRLKDHALAAAALAELSLR